MGRIEEKKREKKKRIFTAAFSLFTTKGFLNTSISDIMRQAKLAKGTFYLYFKDKDDVRNQLISSQSSSLFLEAQLQLKQTKLTNFEDKIIFIVDYIINSLEKNPPLVDFMAKNLGWGVFKSALIHPDSKNDLDFYKVYESLILESNEKFKNPEVLLFMLIELVGSTCHSTILYNEPLPIEEYKPFLYKTIKDIIHGQIIEEDEPKK